MVKDPVTGRGVTGDLDGIAVAAMRPGGRVRGPDIRD